MKKQLMGAAVASIVTIGAVGTIGAIQTIDTHTISGVTQVSAEAKEATQIDTNATKVDINITSNVALVPDDIITTTIGNAEFTSPAGRKGIDAGGTKVLTFEMTEGETLEAADAVPLSFEVSTETGTPIEAEITTDTTFEIVEFTVPLSYYTEKNIALDFVSDELDNQVIDIDPTLGTDLIIYADPSQEAKDFEEKVTSVDVILNGTELEVEGKGKPGKASVWTTSIDALSIIDGGNTLDIMINTSIDGVDTQGLTLNHTFEGAPKTISQTAIVGIVIGSFVVVGLITAGGGYYFSTTRKSD